MSDDIRDVARKRIKARSDFWVMVGIFAGLSVLFTVIWFIGGADSYFWPAWPMLGFAIATFFNGLSTFGPGSRPITEDRIDAEVRKINGGS